MLHGYENTQERQSLSSYSELSHHSPTIHCLCQLSCCSQLLPQMLVPTSGLQFVTSSAVPKQLRVEQCLNQRTEVVEVKNKLFVGGAEEELFLIVITSMVFLPVWSHKEFH